MEALAELQPDPLVLGRLQAVYERSGLGDLSLRLAAVTEFARGDLGSVERELQGFPLHATSVGHSAVHLLGHSGKRLRPLSVALASRAGSGFGERARQLAVAVELVHTA